jgi:hypothetical protein
MEKRGQVTIFIIIAVLVIAGVALFFTFKSDIGIGKQEMSSVEIAPIKAFVQECLESSVEEGIYYLGIQGGYYETPKPKEIYLTAEIPVYWNVDSENIPTKETIELELVTYVLDDLYECLEGLEEFENKGFEIKEEASSGEVVISSRVNFKLNYPMVIEKGDSKSKIEDFSYVLNFDFMSKHNLARMIIENQKENPEMFAMGFISALAYEKGFVYETMDLGEGKMILSLIFNEFDKEGYPFVYSFVINYGEENED